MTTTLIRETERLRLIAASAEHLEAEIASADGLGRLLGAEVPPDWPPGEYDRGAQEFFHKRMLSDGPAVLGWYVWYVVLRPAQGSLGTLIASGGFFGPPNPAGIVEIGFSVLPLWRGRGIAGELAKSLIAFAFADKRTQLIIAHTSTTNRASCIVLEHCGFRCVGPGLEPDQVRYEKKVSE